MIKVSVIVPIYNAEQYLKQCLDSIVNQTLRDIEIILIDDGSTDGSGKICKSYLTDSRVSYFYKENEGLAAARDDGMKRASGDYIGFVDADDWLEPNMYEKMYEAAVSNVSDVVFCNCIQNENDHYFTPEMRIGAFNREEIISEILPRTLAYIDKNGGKRSIRWCNWLRLYRRDHLIKYNIVFDRRLRRSQDLQLTYEATLHAQNYYYLGDDYLYHNRVVNDSLSRGYTKNMWTLYKYLIDVLYADTEQFPELNLMNQMHLRTFFFVLDCIENEMKPLCPNSKERRLELVNEIVSDPLCKVFIDKIPVHELNPLYQEYYKLILKQDAEGILKAADKYQRKIKIEKTIIRPLKHFITEGPIIGTIYKKIRRKK